MSTAERFCHCRHHGGLSEECPPDKHPDCLVERVKNGALRGNAKRVQDNQRARSFAYLQHDQHVHAFRKQPRLHELAQTVAAGLHQKSEPLPLGAEKLHLLERGLFQKPENEQVYQALLNLYAARKSGPSTTDGASAGSDYANALILVSYLDLNLSVTKLEDHTAASNLWIGRLASNVSLKNPKEVFGLVRAILDATDSAVTMSLATSDDAR